MFAHKIVAVISVPTSTHTQVLWRASGMAIHWPLRCHSVPFYSSSPASSVSITYNFISGLTCLPPLSEGDLERICRFGRLCVLQLKSAAKGGGAFCSTHSRHASFRNVTYRAWLGELLMMGRCSTFRWDERRHTCSSALAAAPNLTDLINAGLAPMRVLNNRFSG